MGFAGEYHVRAWRSWVEVGVGRRTIDRSYATAEGALEAALALSPVELPLVEVIFEGRVIADRSLVPYPTRSGPFTPRDNIAEVLDKARADRRS